MTVHRFKLDNADPTVAQQPLDDLFSGQSTSSSRSRTTTEQAGTQLNTRAQQPNQKGGATRNNPGSGGDNASPTAVHVVRSGDTACPTLA